MDIENYEAIFGERGSQNVFVSTEANTTQEQTQLTEQLEKELLKQGIKVSEVINVEERTEAFVFHLKVMVQFLNIIAVLAVAIGGISIFSVIGINIMERKREIGVMLALGSNHKQVRKIIATEAVLMGLLGWVIGVVVAIPISILTGNFFGQMFLQTNLSNSMSFVGAALWLVISVLISYFSGTLQTRQIARCP